MHIYMMKVSVITYKGYHKTGTASLLSLPLFDSQNIQNFIKVQVRVFGHTIVCVSLTLKGISHVYQMCPVKRAVPV